MTDLGLSIAMLRTGVGAIATTIFVEKVVMSDFIYIFVD